MMSIIKHVLVISFCMSSVALANPVKLSPRKNQGEMQFGVNCSYFEKDNMFWQLLTVVDESLPGHLHFAFFNKKTKTHISEWMPIETSGNLITIANDNFDIVSNLLMNLSVIDIHFKNKMTDEFISHYFPLSDYRIKYPRYFIDAVKLEKGCLIEKSDLPLD